MTARPSDTLGSEDICWIVLAQNHDGTWEINIQTPFEEAAAEQEEMVRESEKRGTIVVYVPGAMVEPVPTREEE